MGTCKKCGECCKWLAFHFPGCMFDPTLSDARGLRWDTHEEVLWIPSICKYLKEDGSCGIYMFRPAACRKYPEGTLNLVPPTCGMKEDKDV